MRVAIIYRVVQGWRVPVFNRLSSENDIKLFYGCDFKGTKVVSAKKEFCFNSKKMFSIPISFRKVSGNILLPFSPFLFFELIKYKPDVVLCEGASNFINNISVFIFCKLFKKPMVQWGLGEIRGKNKSKLRRMLDLLIIPIEKRSNAVIAYSSTGAEYYKKIGVPASKIFIAVNVVDTDQRKLEIEEFEKNKKMLDEAADNRFRVLFVGALEANKNIEILIRAFGELSELQLNVELHIVGDGTHRAVLENLVDTIGIRDMVTFHGRIQGPLVETIHNMDVFVMPGLGGLAVSDMLCHGIPIICGVGDGCEADLINSKNGILDDCLDGESLLKYLVKLNDDPELLNSMKASAKETSRVYNIDNYVSQIRKALNYSVGDASD